MRLSPFGQHIKRALEHYHDQAWLDAHSPLAQAYVLGASPADAPTGWGATLQRQLYDAALSLWGKEPPRNTAEIEGRIRQGEHSPEQYAFWVLALTYFHTFLPPDARAPLLQVHIYDDILHVSRATFDRHLHAAIELLSERFGARTQPTLRLERPRRAAPLVGRDELTQRALRALYDGKTVALLGTGGSGKTALSTAIGAAWQGHAFWWTVRPTLNDRLPSLLHALGTWLHGLGVHGLWQLVAAGRDAALDPALALDTLRHDLAAVDTAPLLVFDELDALLARDESEARSPHAQLLVFVQSVRGVAPMLVIEQRQAIESDTEIAVPGLDAREVAHFLDAAGVASDRATAERLREATGGNPRLLHLCVRLREDGESIAAVLDRLPPTLAFHPLFDRVWNHLNAADQGTLMRLSVFRSAVPRAALDGATVGALAERHLLETDAGGGVALLPALRGAVYHKLAAPARQQLHAEAAALRASLGEYTAAAFHYERAGDAARAIDVWFGHMEYEIARGQGPGALATFEQIGATSLDAAHGRRLALVLARLYRLLGTPEAGLAALAHAPWTAPDVLHVRKLEHEGFFHQVSGDTDRALVAYEQGIAEVDALLAQRAELLVQIGRAHQRKRDTARARHAAQRIKFEWERLQGIIEEEAGVVAAARTHFWSALATAEALDDAALIADAYYHLAILHARIQEGASALDYFERAMRHYERVGDLFQVHRTRSNIAATFVQLEQYARVAPAALPALRYWETINHPLMIAAVGANLAEASFYTGDLVAAEGYAALVLRQEELAYVPYALYTLGLVERARGDGAAAERAFRRSAEIAEHNEDPHILAYARQQWGIVAVERGDTATGEEHLRAARALFQTLKLHNEVTKTEECLERLSIRTGDERGSLING
jgi:tetratricopeptide (TPR) repeat protein